MREGASLRARIMTGYALCSIAERSSRAGELHHAAKTIQAIRAMVAEISPLLDQPHSHSEIREARDALSDLERRLQGIAAALPCDEG
jgi:hypothetical protein